MLTDQQREAHALRIAAMRCYVCQGRAVALVGIGQLMACLAHLPDEDLAN